MLNISLDWIWRKVSQLHNVTDHPIQRKCLKKLFESGQNGADFYMTDLNRKGARTFQKNYSGLAAILTI